MCLCNSAPETTMAEYKHPYNLVRSYAMARGMGPKEPPASDQAIRNLLALHGLTTRRCTVRVDAYYGSAPPRRMRRYSKKYVIFIAGRGANIGMVATNETLTMWQAMAASWEARQWRAT